MFNEKPTSRIDTLIGEQCNIVGSLNGSGTLKVDGSIDGDILWQDDIIIGESSRCKGNISCSNATITGNVEGNIICDGTLTIDEIGHVKGDITVKNLCIKQGGTLDGKCTMVIQACTNKDLLE